MTKKDSKTPELDALLKHQTEINVAQQQLDALQGCIKKQEDAQVALREQIPALEALEQQREALLAEVAIGAADSADLDDLNQKISGAEVQKAEIEPAIIRCQQTIAGLQRKVVDQTSLVNFLKKHSEILTRNYLLAEADVVAQSYLKNARAMGADSLRLDAICEALLDLGHPYASRHPGATVQAPAYNLPAFEKVRQFHNKSMTIIGDIGTVHERIARKEEEFGRLRALGIECGVCE